MKFKEYRRKETIRAAEISEEKMMLLSAIVKDGANQEEVFPFTKGNYAENRDGVLYGWSKEDFENAFAPVRAPRQASNGQKRKRKASV